MTNKVPENRPTAGDALCRFHQLMSQVGDASLNKRLRPKDEPIVVHYIHEISSSLGALLQSMKQIFGELSHSDALWHRTIPCLTALQRDRTSHMPPFL